MAKRGMLALSTEFIGMGELRADVEHNRIGHLDLCGVAGIGVVHCSRADVVRHPIVGRIVEAYEGNDA